MRITKSSQEKNKKKNFKKVLQRAKRKIKGITLIALVVTTIFSYDENVKSSNNKGFLLQSI